MRNNGRLGRLSGRFVGTRASGVALLVFLAVMWELSVARGWIESLTWPRLSNVAVALFDTVISGEIVSQMWTTTWRIAVGFAAATALGILLGTLMGSIKWVDNLFEPITELLRPIPVSALVPVAILFFGIRSQMKIAMIIYAAVWPVLLNTFRGVKNADGVLIETSRTFGFSTGTILWKVRLPAAAPFIATGMRLSLAVALVVAIVAEMIAGGDGMGVYILQRQRTFHVPEMYAAIIVLAVFGYLLNRVFVFIEKRIVFWGGMRE